jgi:hypothetical protein
LNFKNGFSVNILIGKGGRINYLEHGESFDKELIKEKIALIEQEIVKTLE